MTSLPIGKKEPSVIGTFDGAPKIDGKLDDPVWGSAKVLGDFYQVQPGDNIAPTQKTEVLIGKDARNLYIAFHCYDSEPSRVRATIPKRDQIFDDDYVGVYLDTFHDKRKAYVLWFNPNGVQADGIFTEDRGEDYSVDVVMESKGEVGPDGWIVEVSVPFKSIRYEQGEGRLWGAQIFRRIKRVNNELDAWMPLNRAQSGTLNQAGTLTGFVGIDTERTLEIIPSVIFSQNSYEIPAPLGEAFVDGSRILQKPVGVDLGVTMKYSITPTVTLDFAANPDFAQIESDALVITANQRFPIFYEEKRPFFLEGIDIFQTPMNVVNTRTIVDPDAAVKLTGKQGRNSFGVMLASDNAPGNYSDEERNDPFLRDAIARFLDKNAFVGAVRLKRDVGAESSIGMFATTYNFIEDHNHLGGFDGRFRLDKQVVWDFQVVGTNSRGFFYNRDTRDYDYRTANGFGYATSYDYTDRNFGWRASQVGRTRDYVARIGFTRRVETNRSELFLRWSNDPNPDATFVGWRAVVFGGANYDWQGRLQNWDSESSISLNFRRETQIGFGWFGGYERLFETEFREYVPRTYESAFTGTDPERTTYRKQIYNSFRSTPLRSVSLNYFFAYTFGAFDYDFGAGPKYPRVSPEALTNPFAPYDPGPGNELFFDFGMEYRPSEALRVNFSFTKDKVTRNDTGLVAFDDNIMSLRGTYQFTRFTFARVRVDYDTLSSKIYGQYLVGWTPNPGTAFYAGYNDQHRYDGYAPYTGLRDPGISLENRTFFIKFSYLFRQSL